MDYNEYLEGNYERIYAKLMRYITSQGYSNEDLEDAKDILSNTIVKVYQMDLGDKTPADWDNYLFKSLQKNLRREKQYARNAKRDRNTAVEAKGGTVTQDQYDEKLLRDLKTDFSVMYLSMRAEQQFGYHNAHLFLVKHLLGKTYAELRKLYPEERRIRETVLEVKAWLRENVTKEELDNAFNEKYGL